MNIARDILFVRCNNMLVGRLIQEHDQLSFEYSKDWLQSKNTFAISISLPLQEKVINDHRVKNFFANLLPEGSSRHLVARKLGISEDNDFALLKAIGNECAGALSIVPDTEMDKTEDNNSYEPLPKKTLKKLMDSPPVFTQIIGTNKLRLSLAGAQDKLPVYMKDNKIFLPNGPLPSSHILKFPSEHFKHLPQNEVLITYLAKSVGLQVVDVELIPVGPYWICLVVRYDRYKDKSGQLVRLHQEDFCQAMGLSHIAKYQADGGPSFADCHRLLVKESQEPMLDTEQLIKWQIFNAIIGNADGHAKNISLLYDKFGSIRLAPFYDLVCTRSYQKLDQKLAMSVCSIGDPGKLRGKDWAKFADDLAVSKKFLFTLIQLMAKQIQNEAQKISKTFASRDEYSAIIQMTMPKITKFARRIVQNLSD